MTSKAALLCPAIATPNQPSRCHQVDCAWWDPLKEQCAVLLVAQRFDAVTTTRDELAVYMEAAP